MEGSTIEKAFPDFEKVGWGEGSVGGEIGLERGESCVACGFVWKMKLACGNYESGLQVF